MRASETAPGRGGNEGSSMRPLWALLPAVVCATACRYDFVPNRQPAIPLGKLGRFATQAFVNVATPRSTEPPYSIRNHNFTRWTVVPDAWNRYFARYVRKELARRGVSPGPASRTVVVRVYDIRFKQLPFYRRRASARFHVWSYDRRINLGFSRSSISGSMDKAFSGLVRSAVVYLLNHPVFVGYILGQGAEAAW